MVLIEIFRKYDKNNDGVISKEELKEMMLEKMKFNENRFETLMRIIDLDGSGTI